MGKPRIDPYASVVHLRSILGERLDEVVPEEPSKVGRGYKLGFSSEAHSLESQGWKEAEQYSHLLSASIDKSFKRLELTRLHYIFSIEHPDLAIWLQRLEQLVELNLRIYPAVDGRFIVKLLTHGPNPLPDLDAVVDRVHDTDILVQGWRALDKDPIIADSPGGPDPCFRGRLFHLLSRDPSIIGFPAIAWRTVKNGDSPFLCVWVDNQSVDILDLV